MYVCVGCFVCRQIVVPSVSESLEFIVIATHASSALLVHICINIACAHFDCYSVCTTVKIPFVSKSCDVILIMKRASSALLVKRTVVPMSSDVIFIAYWSSWALIANLCYAVVQGHVDRESDYSVVIDRKHFASNFHANKQPGSHNRHRQCGSLLFVIEPAITDLLVSASDRVVTPHPPHVVSK